MDVEANNFFAKWVRRTITTDKVYYIPNQNVVKDVFKRSGIRTTAVTEQLFEPYQEVKKGFLSLWSDSSISYDPVTKTAEHKGFKFKVTHEEFAPKSDSVLRFINGWIGDPNLGTYLVRLLKNDGQNKENPFNLLRDRLSKEVVRQQKGDPTRRAGYPRFFPDVNYLPKLYELLGVKSFEEIGILGTGDYANLWKGIVLRHNLDYPTMKIFQQGEEMLGYAYVLWKDMTTDYEYLSSFPEEILERLHLIVAQNRKTVGSERWTKDPFQKIVSKLKGKDLVSLCLTDQKFGKLCDADQQIIFRQKLMEEFGLDYFENDHGYESPFSLYIQMYKFFEFVEMEFPEEEGLRASYHLAMSVKGVAKTRKSLVDRLVTLVPPPDMPKRDLNKSTNTFAVFFPSTPELSFYVYTVYGLDQFNEEKPLGYRVLAVFDTHMIEKYLRKEDILTMAQKIMDAYDEETDDFDVIPTDNFDVSWLLELSGDDEVRLLRSHYDTSK